MVRHVLLDADDVLQHVPGGWIDSLRPYLGERTEDFLHTSWSEEHPALRGEVDFHDILARNLVAFGYDGPLAEIFEAVWHSIEVVPESVALVHELRAAGYGVHLGTNQEAHRAAYMRGPLGYDDLFDVSCYSCDLGAAKPDPAYFARAVERIGDHAGEVLFVDDRPANVEGARTAGLVAVEWCLADGHDELRSRLAAGGVTLSG